MVIAEQKGSELIRNHSFSVDLSDCEGWQASTKQEWGPYTAKTLVRSNRLLFQGSRKLMRDSRGDSGEDGHVWCIWIYTMNVCIFYNYTTIILSDRISFVLSLGIDEDVRVSSVYGLFVEKVQLLECHFQCVQSPHLEHVHSPKRTAVLTAEARLGEPCPIFLGSNAAFVDEKGWTFSLFLGVTMCQGYPIHMYIYSHIHIHILVDNRNLPVGRLLFWMQSWHESFTSHLWNWCCKPQLTPAGWLVAASPPEQRAMALKRIQKELQVSAEGDEFCLDKNAVEPLWNLKG